VSKGAIGLLLVLPAPRELMCLWICYQAVAASYSAGRGHLETARFMLLYAAAVWCGALRAVPFRCSN